ncbi:MAG: hypothetical protein ACTTI5_05105 [Treponema sp.]
MAFISKLYILLVQEKVGKFRVSEKLEIKAINLPALSKILLGTFLELF